MLVARRFGISANHLALVLAGRRRASLSLAQRIADYIGIPVAAFLSWMTPPPGHPPRRRRINVETPAGQVSLLASGDAAPAELRAACTALLQQVVEGRRLRRR